MRSVLDELGNVVGQVTGTAVTQRVAYDPWGKPLFQVNASGNKLLWKGLMYEDTVGLYYVRNRWYDPDVGRFISEDPLGLKGGINMYVFGNDDPINFADPTGLYTYVACRPLQDASEFGHCGIRVYDRSRALDVTIELLIPDGNHKEIYWWSARGDRITDGAVSVFGGRWAQVSIPGGMTERSFDDAVLRLALMMTMRERGQPYTKWGDGNSNRFVYNVITQAGGFVPASVTNSFWSVPGVCGGTGPFTGENCK